MIRGSESAEHTLSTSRKPRRLTKLEFIEQVEAGARRWGQPFRQSHLNEFMKQGLIEPAAREYNDGRKPNYTFGYSHYRRALQLLRLRAADIRDTDALAVQLFIRGYRIDEVLFKTAIIKEAERAVARINTYIRSTYADRPGPIPSERKKSILAQIGDQDERFIGGRFELDTSLVLAVLRIARSPTHHGIKARLPNDIPIDLAPVAQLVAGLLMISDRESNDRTIIASIVGAAHQSDLAEVQAGMASIIAGVRIEARSEAHLSNGQEWQAAARSWWQREFLAMMFIVMLNALAQNPGYGTGASNL